jgi:acyl-CoA synthetase (AMP-forming)/AMP-acid ligase II
MEMSLGSILRISAHKFPHGDSIVCENDRVTFVQLNEKVNQRARALLDLGIQKGDHVATLASNCKELVETIFAILTIGALLVPLNIRLSPRELSYVLDHGDVSTLIFLTGFEEIAQKVQPMVSRIERFLAMGGNPPPGFVDFDAITAQQGKEEPPGEVEEEDVAMILYTAGTTGKPKGVVLTHKSWLWSAMNGTTSFRVRPGMKTLTVYPFFHAAGFFNLFISVFNAAPLVTLQKFDPDRFLKIMEREKVNRVANPPTIYNRILQVPDIGRYD